MLSGKCLAPMALVAFLAGCTDPAKAPADAAIKGAEAALATVRTEAAKYVPDQLKAVEAGLAGAKDAFAKGEFKAALDAAKDLPAKATALATAVAARKDELTKAYGAATAELPKVLGAIKTRVEALSKMKKLPKGIDKAKLASAKEGLASVSQQFEAAAAQLKAGALAEAVGAARPLQERATGIAKSIGAKLDAAPKK